MTDDELRSKFEQASNALAQGAKKSHNSPVAIRNEIERRYGDSYKKLMNRGLAPRLKRKYRE